MTPGPYARAARLYRASGWLGTLPVTGKGKTPDGRVTIPAGFTGKGGSWPSSDQVDAWRQARGNDNIAIRLPRNIIGIDVDAYDGRFGLKTLTEYEERLGKLPPTHCMTSRDDGSGIRLFLVPDNISWVSDLGRGSNVEIIRHDHRYVVAWPSVHPDTQQEYRIIIQAINTNTEIIPRIDQITRLPDAWITALTRSDTTPSYSNDADNNGASGYDRGPRVDPELMLVIGAPPGEQDEMLFRYLCHLRSRKLSMDEALTLGVIAIERMENARPDDPWTPQHVAEKVQRIWRDHPAGTSAEQALSSAQRSWAQGFMQPAAVQGADTQTDAMRSAPIGRDTSHTASAQTDVPPGCVPEAFTDTGNADRYARLFAKKKLRYIPETKQWHVWNGQRWTPDANGATALDLTRQIPPDIRTSILVSDDDDMVSEGARHAITTESERSRKAIINLACTLPSFSVSLSTLDTNPSLIACNNGIIELESSGWRFRAATPEDCTSLNTNIDFDPAAQSADWDAFVTYIQPDINVRNYLQAMDGYSLYGANPLRIWLLLHGPSSTGKTTYLECISHALGDYCSPVNASIFRDDQTVDKPRADIVAALPRRRIQMSEAAQETFMHADQIKRATGNVSLTARPQFSRSYVTRIPAFMPIMDTNVLPTIENVDDALRSRIKVIPFLSKIDTSPDSAILDVVKRLSVDIPTSAILHWLLDGWTMYCKGKLDEPLSAIDVSSMQAHNSFSPFSDFIDAYCDIDPEYYEPSRNLMAAYKLWAQETGNVTKSKVSARVLSTQLRSHGFTYRDRIWVQFSDGSKRQLAMWYGLKIRTEYANKVSMMVAGF